MEELWDILKQSGPVATVLGLVVYFLWKKNESREAKIEALQEEIQDLLEKRVQENGSRFDMLVSALQESERRRTGSSSSATSYSHTTRTKPTQD